MFIVLLSGECHVYFLFCSLFIKVFTILKFGPKTRLVVLHFRWFPSFVLTKALRLQCILFYSSLAISHDYCVISLPLLCFFPHNCRNPVLSFPRLQKVGACTWTIKSAFPLSMASFRTAILSDTPLILTTFSPFFC